MRLMKRMACLMLVMMLAVSGSSADMNAGKVSAAAATEIYDENDWNAFADIVNSGTSDASAVLMADFTATADFVQIYSEFSGIFDGKGHTITGLTTSMFDYVYGGTVKNLTVKEVNITEYVGYYSVGAIADDLVGGIVDNCIAEGGSINVSGSSVGGVVGYISKGAVVSNCVNNADVSATKQVGGVVGVVNDGSVYNCANNGSVTAEEDMAGGIAGDVYPDEEKTAKIYNSYNTGSVSADEYAGGIAGQIVAYGASVAFHSIYNTGAISGRNVIGGIAGIVETVNAFDTITVNNACNSGSVKSKGSVAGAVIGKSIPAAAAAVSSKNTSYVKDTNINSSLYSVGDVNSSIQSSDCFGSVSYLLEDYKKGKTAYDMNNYNGFGRDWSYWSYDGSSIMLADDDSVKTHKVTYMSIDGEFRTVYSLDTGLYEVIDLPAEINGSVFAGWFKKNLGTVDAVTADVLSSAVDFSEKVSGDLILYPVYLSTGTVVEDKADTFNSVKYDNSGLYLQGAQIREPDASAGVTAGLRFITRISTAFIKNVEALNEENASLRPASSSDKGIGYGTVITAKSNIAAGNKLVKDLSASSVMKGMYVAPAVINYKEYNGYVFYTALVVGIPEAYYTTDIAARPYITYCDANGIERTYYYTETSSASTAGGAYYTSYQKVYNYVYGVH